MVRSADNLSTLKRAEILIELDYPIYGSERFKLILDELERGDLLSAHRLYNGSRALRSYNVSLTGAKFEEHFALQHIMRRVYTDIFSFSQTSSILDKRLQERLVSLGRRFGTLISKLDCADAHQFTLASLQDYVSLALLKDPWFMKNQIYHTYCDFWPISAGMDRRGGDALEKLLVNYLRSSNYKKWRSDS